LLSVEEVGLFFKDVQILHSVSFHIDEKEIVALVGANGAGKSTMINAISGINHPQQGKINYMDERSTRNPPTLL